MIYTPRVDSVRDAKVNGLFLSWPHDDHTPLFRVQDFLRDHVASGCLCPACGQRVKLSLITLTGGKALTLVRMYAWGKSHGNAMSWIHVIREANNFGLPSRDYSSCSFWGLTETGLPPGTKSSGDGNPDSGWWRLTPLGVQFVEGLVQVPQRVVVWKGAVLGFSREETVIKKSLGTKFNYEAEVNRVW